MACWIYITYLLTNGAKVICIWFFLTDICMNNVLCLAIYGTDWCFCCAHISFCVFWFAILWPNHSFIWAHIKRGSVIINMDLDIRINNHFCQYNIIGIPLWFYIFMNIASNIHYIWYYPCTICLFIIYVDSKWTIYIPTLIHSREPS